MSPRAGSCAPSEVRRGALTHVRPRDTAPAEVWAPPGTLPNPGLLCVAAPGHGHERPFRDILSGMQGLKAHVRSGRIVVDEPTDLPEGSELELVVVGNDALDEEDERELSALIDLALDDEDAGRKVNTEAFLEEVRVLACR